MRPSSSSSLSLDTGGWQNMTWPDSLSSLSPDLLVITSSLLSSSPHANRWQKDRLVCYHFLFVIFFIRCEWMTKTWICQLTLPLCHLCHQMRVDDKKIDSSVNTSSMSSSSPDASWWQKDRFVIDHFLFVTRRESMTKRSICHLSLLLCHLYHQMRVDDKKIDLPPVEGIIVLNITSWASGANPWGPEKDDHFLKVRIEAMTVQPRYWAPRYWAPAYNDDITSWASGANPWGPEKDDHFLKVRIEANTVPPRYWAPSY